MRRADRLFQIIQVLRRSAQPVTAELLALELEVSKRSIYRDIADLIARRVPIRGEAGLGYVLERGFDMPPLMLTPDELEAAVLGAQWVAERGDPALAGAARDLIAKLEHAVPEVLRRCIAQPSIGAPVPLTRTIDGLDLGRARASIRAGRKLSLRYRDQAGAVSDRVVWPVVIGYAEAVRVLAAWCELRQGFRHFRTDRVLAAEFLDEAYDCSPRQLRVRWERYMSERGSRLAEVTRRRV
jgi:predicted DNA-binding transcriptional regulator YafY